MLELKGITKTYHAAGEDVNALKGIDLSFRKSEFVSVLGPSGCGKTTLLNIIGGLDHFDDGDLIINGTSTKQYKARDWDTYRNHSVGFVFQSYNLIPHQTVLANVELSLTLTGVSKKERRRRAKEALEMVGLGNQLRKRPGAMSGGQCQRVAIARAIVNNPDIILADEPTGALDTETGIQVMEILKEISKDRLVIMVTHNPELAQQYSTRIVRMLDGRITDDTNPLTEADIAKEKQLEKELLAGEDRKAKKPSMSAATSFSLSLKNLFTKKGRTLLTSFAGSIGIIGIALIYAVSQGTNDFIASVQEETLSSYPIKIEAQTLDASSMMSVFLSDAESLGEHENDAIYQKVMISRMLNAFNSLESRKNDLESFKVWLDSEINKEDSEFASAVSGIQYSYDTGMVVYTRNVDGKIVASDPTQMMMNLYSKYLGIDMSGMMSLTNSTVMGSSYTSSMSNNMNLWKELLPGKNGDPISDVIERQYDIVYGSWPNEYNEVILFVDEKNEIDDMTLYALGLTPESAIEAMMDATLNHTTLEINRRSWSYEEICAMSFRAVLPSDCFYYDAETGACTDLRNSEAGLEYLYDNSLELKVVGIARPSASAVSSSRNSRIGYTHLLTDHVINKAHNAPAVVAQMENPGIDVFTGLPFAGSAPEGDTAEAFRAKVAAASDAEKAEIYRAIVSRPASGSRDEYIQGVLGSITREELEQMAIESMSGQFGVNAKLISSYMKKMSDEELFARFAESLGAEYDARFSGEAAAKLEGKTDKELADMLDASAKFYSDEDCREFYSLTVKYSDSTYEDNLKTLGLTDASVPSSVSLFTSTFAGKDVITDAIAKYNESVPELERLEYTDFVGLIMSSVTTIIDAIAYVLIAFVAVSLIVSSIMIGVITLISVQERTKEIGILRAIGASKRNVSGMFNAETMMIGFSSGLVGVLITYLICLPINIILHALTDIEGLSAVLPIPAAIVLIMISTLLTLIAGIIPSRSAAKKDPVIALRSE